MLTVDAALAEVLAPTAPLAACELPAVEAIGLVLAANLASDIDSPPYDKALVDGYAVVAAELAAGPARLRVLEEVTAGRTPIRPLEPGAATRIMTGAPLPAGCDAVAMIERCRLDPLDAGYVVIDDPGLEPGYGVLRQGAAWRAGEVVVAAGHQLRAIDMGLLAEIGRVRAPVIRRPRVAILSTGDELVDAAARPGAGQIRNSNGPLLAALTRAAGADAVELGVARDEPNELRTKIAAGLAADVLVLSGGVSAGVLDLVPAALEELGVRQVFHKVRLKPGKPLWFGVTGDAAPRLVFGLPGNPVSGAVCFTLFVRPALAMLAGRPDQAMWAVSAARLAAPFHHRGERDTFHPALAERTSTGDWQARLVAWRGSADQRALADANCLARFPAGDRHYEAGDEIEVVWL